MQHAEPRTTTHGNAFYPMGGNRKNFERKYLLIQVGRQCASAISAQKYGSNQQGGRNNNRFGNGFGNGGSGNNKKQNNDGFRQQTHQAKMVAQVPAAP